MSEVKKNTKDKAALMPRLRFPEFRDAACWETTPLGELGVIVTGKTPSTKENDLWGGEILFITPTDITEGEKYQHNTQRTVVETAGTKVLPPGSIVYTCIASIGKMALTVIPSVTNQQINAVILNGKTARDYVYYSLENLTSWIKAIPATSTLPIINKTQFSQFIIPHPEDKLEQQKIADCLSSLDDLIAAETQKLNTLKTHKKGLMQQLFPREGETVPRLRFPEFRDAGEWERLTVAEVCEINPSRTNKQDHELVSFIPMAAVSEDGRIESPQIRTHVEVKKGYTSFIENDVIIAKITPCFENGKAALAKGLKNGAGFGSTEFHVFRAHKPCLPEFLFLQLNRDIVRIEGTRNMVGNAGQRRVPVTFFEVFPFYLPTIEEQQTIVGFLLSLDEFINAQAQKIDTLKTHKKGLMQQLFPVLDEVGI